MPGRSGSVGGFRFCPLCATELTLRADGARMRLSCPSCGFVHYHNPVPAAGGIICRGPSVCLVRRAVDPRRGCWSLPAGFVEYDETPAQCASREIAEETGLQVSIEEPLGVYAGLDDPRSRAILIVYWAREVGQSTPVAGDDADQMGFFPPHEVPAQIAFRAHRQALDDAFRHPRFGASGVA
ncbi:MAG: NUDIX hydrolase [candidate division Zixibacteria bacterium]|nr:NUDIX hydrolase [candidate division Zixibacteria bacterium]